jgi:sialic acid synthase SpsE
MIKYIRSVEVSMGDGIKRPTRKEEDIKSLARRSIFTTAALKRGDKFSFDNLSIIRPGEGIEPKYLDIIINKTAKKAMDKNTALQWNDF